MADTEDQLTDFARDMASHVDEYDPEHLEVDEDEEDKPWEEDEEGNVTVHLSDEDEDELDDAGFDANLAEMMDAAERTELGQKILDLIEQDIRDREPHDKKYAEGIRRSGLGDDAPGGAAFEGSSVVTHPIMTECAIDFQSSAMKEICPPQGPVKTKIMGPITTKKRQQSERKRDFMNWQLTEQIEEYIDTTENLLMQLPFSGSQYMHFFYDEDLGRVSVELLTSDHVYVPYGTANFYQATRMTIKAEYSEIDVEDKIESGEWVDINSIAPSMSPERTKTSAASDKVEGVDDPVMNEDGLKVFYKVFLWWSLDVDANTKGKRAPYVMVIDSDTGEIPTIRRNWDEEDRKRRKIDHVVEYKFFPWKGPYGIGFTHMIGGMSAAMTGALRALLDTAHINNYPSLLKLKSKTGGQTTMLEATGITEIEGSTPVDDIRKLIMPVPFNPPSQVLFQLLGWLDSAAKGVVSTAEEKIADATSNMPVGTTLALIEQGSKAYANIHGRLHRSVKKGLKILHYLNKQYLDEQVIVEELGDLVIHRKDFEGPMDIIPVSDPHIFSESQRYAQLQAVRQIKSEDPDLFNRRALVKRELQQLRIDNPDELLIPEPDISKANPVAENIMMAKGRPAAAFPDQDHMAHIKVLVTFMQDPNLGQSPIIAPRYLPLALQHLAEHLILWYGTYIYESAGAVVGPEFQQYLEQDELAPTIDKLLGVMADQIHGAAAETLRGIPDVIKQAQQILQSFAPPQDPRFLEVQRKEKRDQMDMGIKGQKLQNDMAKAGAKHEIDEQRIEAAQNEQENTLEIEEQRIAANLLKSQRDNATAMTIADWEIQAGKKTNQSTGEG